MILSSLGKKIELLPDVKSSYNDSYNKHNI